MRGARIRRRPDAMRASGSPPALGPAGRRVWGAGGFLRRAARSAGPGPRPSRIPATRPRERQAARGRQGSAAAPMSHSRQCWPHGERAPRRIAGATQRPFFPAPAASPIFEFAWRDGNDPSPPHRPFFPAPEASPHRASPARQWPTGSRAPLPRPRLAFCPVSTGRIVGATLRAPFARAGCIPLPCTFCRQSAPVLCRQGLARSPDRGSARSRSRHRRHRKFRPRRPWS